MTLATASAARAQAQYELLYQFGPTPPPFAENPFGALVQADNGNIYGVTSADSAGGGPVLFRWDPSPGAATPFKAISPLSIAFIGGLRDWGPVKATDGTGNLYFVGTHLGCSNLFKVDTTLETVNKIPIVCGSPLISSELTWVKGANGASDVMYAISSTQGVSDPHAYLARINTDGSSSLASPSFQAAIGNTSPQALFTPLVAGSDGWLYGARSQGSGASPESVLFRVHPVTGAVERLHDFSLAAGFPEGMNPRGRLLEVPPAAGAAISFLGVTENGGLQSGGTNNNFGTIFRLDIAANGTVSFANTYFFLSDPSYQGVHPRAGIIRGPDGNLYGTATRASAATAPSIECCLTGLPNAFLARTHS